MLESATPTTEGAPVAPPAQAWNQGAHAWDKAAEGWNSNAALIRVWLADATTAMLDAAHVGEGARVLDIAAGAGDQTLDIARRVGSKGHVLATDISPCIIALAQTNAQQAGMTQVETRIADAQTLGESLGSAGSNFDAAVCRLGLMFCTRPLDALVGARKALMPGGRLAALVFSQPQHNPCLAIMMSTALRAAGLPARSPFEPGMLMSLGQPELLAHLLHDAGFADISVTPLAAPFYAPTVRHYIDFVRTSGSPIMEILRCFRTKHKTTCGGISRRNSPPSPRQLDGSARTSCFYALEQCLQNWFTAAEQYLRQLHEVDRPACLAMKRAEVARQQVER